jgi:hypothetical protein
MIKSRLQFDLLSAGVEVNATFPNSDIQKDLLGNVNDFVQLPLTSSLFC